MATQTGPVWSTNPNGVTAKAKWDYPNNYTISKVEIKLWKLVGGTPQSISTVNIQAPPAIALQGNLTLSDSPLSSGEYYVVTFLYWDNGCLTGTASLTLPHHTFP
jgi:hypothetical protein